MLNSVGMSVEAWMLAGPRRAMMPPPGRAMLPRSSCRVEGGGGLWVAAQGHDAAAGTADVAQQQLQDRGGADHLGADAVLGPADRVAERGGALTAGVGRQRLGDLRELLGLDAADLLHHLGGVAREVP